MELGTLVKRGYPIALNNYPIFDEGHRAILNNKIIRHYYFREICCDSPERFNFYLETKMDEIMPYYNQLYKSELLEYNPLATEFYSETNSLSKEAKKAVENYIKKIAEESTGDNYSGSKRENLNEDTKRDASGTETNKAIRTDKLKEVTVTDETNSNTRTDDLTEAVETTSSSTKNSDATNDSTTTNALKTTNSSENSGSGTSKTSGNKVTGFSDIPQAGYETTVTENADGSVTTTSKGYLTTRTTESTNEQNATTTKETGKATTDNTGTVTVKSELKQKDEISETNSSIKTNTGTVENAGSVDKTVTKDNTGTQNNDSDGATTETETGSKTNKNNIYEDTQRNVFVSSKNVGENAEQEKRHEKENGELFAEGRRGISPADLIKKYREIIQNVDMMIVDELNDLFMGVF